MKYGKKVPYLIWYAKVHCPYQFWIAQPHHLPALGFTECMQWHTLESVVVSHPPLYILNSYGHYMHTFRVFFDSPRYACIVIRMVAALLYLLSSGSQWLHFHYGLLHSRCLGEAVQTMKLRFIATSQELVGKNSQVLVMCQKGLVL